MSNYFDNSYDRLPNTYSSGWYCPNLDQFAVLNNPDVDVIGSSSGFAIDTCKRLAELTGIPNPDCVQDDEVLLDIEK